LDHPLLTHIGPAADEEDVDELSATSMKGLLSGYSKKHIKQASQARQSMGLGVRFPIHHAAHHHLHMRRTFGSEGALYGRKKRGWLHLRILGGQDCAFVKACPHFTGFNPALALWIKRSQPRIEGLSWPDVVSLGPTPSLATVIRKLQGKSQGTSKLGNIRVH
jgi:hypothetical protein